MIYLDTDFLIHYLVVQDKEIHRFVNKKIHSLIEKDLVFISFLTLQEVSFVLSKLNYESFEILEKIEKIEKFAVVNYGRDEFELAQNLASKIGFQNINDCLHTAIAENYCSELFRFFVKNCGKIKKYDSLYQPALFEHNQNSV